MPLFRPVQALTRVSPIFSGGVPPSGNLPVHSPFTGAFRPRIPIGQGAGSSNLVTGQRLSFSVPTISAHIAHLPPNRGSY